MAEAAKTIHVKSDTMLAPLLEEAAKAPIVLERGGAYFRLEALEPPDDWTSYDPDEVIAALDEVAGILSADEADTLIADLYRAREEGSRPANRP
jgi:hypothetical protein